MKKIKLLSFEIRNFKRINDLTIKFDGKNYIVLGRNESGKTTIVDAFIWLLFDKNLNGNSKFSVKTLTKDGEVLHRLEHSVTALFRIDDTDTREFKKVYSEKWTKKHGSAEQEFTGHTNEYFIDGIIKSESEYKAAVGNMCDEQLFRMITNPLYFNTLDNKKKRDILLKAIPGVSDEIVIDTSKSLEPLRDLLSKQSVEDLLKTKKAALKKINEQLDGYGYSIKENDRLLLDKSHYPDDKSDLEAIDTAFGQIEYYEKQLLELEKEYENKSNMGEILGIREDIRELKVELADKKSSFTNTKTKDLNRQYAEIDRKINELENTVSGIEFNVNIIKRDINQKNIELHNTTNKIEELYAQYDEIENSIYSGNDNCPFCGQSMPKEIINQSIAKFNQDKSSKLEQIIKTGKEYRQFVVNLELNIKELELKLPKYNDQIAEIKDQIVIKMNERTEINSDLANSLSLENEEIAAINQEIERLQYLEKSTMQQSSLEIELQLKRKLDETKKLLAEWREIKQKHELNIKYRARIQELINEQTETTRQYQDASKIIKLCEEFIVAKVKLIEDDINNLFTTVKFKMFETQINGGINETCTATVDGVPWPDVNTGGKLNAGLDIIKTLQQIYQVEAPIFIDNAEAITHWKVTPSSQTIKLYANPNYEKLEFMEEK